jgi:hypothetical protein
MAPLSWVSLRIASAKGRGMARAEKKLKQKVTKETKMEDGTLKGPPSLPSLPSVKSSDLEPGVSNAANDVIGGTARINFCLHGRHRASILHA